MIDMSHWWNDLPISAKLASIASIITISIGIPSAWAIFGFPVPATREWVNAQYGVQLRSHGQTLYDIRRSQLDREIWTLRQQTNRNQAEEWRMHQLELELQILDKREGK